MPNPVTSRRGAWAATALATLGLAACGGASPSPTAPAAPAPSPPTGAAGAAAPSATTTAATTTSAGVNPNQRETLPPGDIPDTIAYVPYTDRALALTIATPEGWSRSTRAGRLVFTDKLNRVEVFSVRHRGTPTPAAIRAAELGPISRSVTSFVLESVSTLVRHAGRVIRIAYLGDSAPDPVTGKVGTLAFERYDFFHGGREYVVLVSSPRGSDNVDPWRTITESVRLRR